MGFFRKILAVSSLLGVIPFLYASAQGIDCTPDPKLFKQLGSLSDAQRDALMKLGGAYDNAMKKCLHAKEVGEARAKEIAVLAQEAKEVQNNSALTRTEKAGMLTGLSNRANEIARNDAVMRRSVTEASNKAKQNLTIAVKKEIKYLTNIVKSVYATMDLAGFDQDMRERARTVACDRLKAFGAPLPGIAGMVDENGRPTDFCKIDIDKDKKVE